MRLIDADEFEAFVRFHCQDSLANLWCELIRMQPVAYDVDKVVEQLYTIGDNANDNISISDCPQY